MSAIDALNTKVTELQATVVAHKAADAVAIQSLQDQIDVLSAQISQGVTDAQIQSVIDALTIVQNELSV